MSVIDELLKMDPACMPGSGHEFEHNLLIQECFGELEKRVKALEEKKPAPAPDLEALVEKYFGQLTKATFDINVPVMQAFKDILRAFAAELGYKP